MEKRYSSLADYLQDVYFDNFSDAIEQYIRESGHSGFSSGTFLLTLSEVELADIHIRAVKASLTDSEFVDFVARVEADIVLKGLGKSDYEADSKTRWFSVYFKAQLLDGLNMLTMDMVDSALGRIQSYQETLDYNWWDKFWASVFGASTNLGVLDQSMKSDFNPEIVAEMSAYVAEVVSAIHQGVQVPEEDLNNLQTILDFLNGLDTTGTGAHIREGIAQGMTEAGFDSDAETVASNLETALNTALQIESPSKRVKPTGEYVAAGVGEGMSGYDFSVDAQDTASGMPYGQFMGYRRGKDGTPEVVEAEADVVRTIFRRFLEGATPAMISRELNLAGVPCPSRKSLLSENEEAIAIVRKKTSRWGTSTVENILANEKYKGDAILQKTYCTDYLLKTFVVNDGSVVPKYYAQNSHPAIVSPEVFDLAQQERAWRRSLNGRYSGRSCFASRVVCGDCGAFYGSKVWHSTDEYRRTIWRCNNKYAGETKCATPHVTQEALEKAFVQVMQQVLSQKDAILAACREALDEAFDTTELDKAATRLQDQTLGMAERVRQLVEENARVQRDQDEFKNDYQALLAEHARLSEKIQAIADQKRDKVERRRRIEIFLHMLEEQKECVGFESGAFVALVDKVIVQRDGRMEFCFRDGMKYEHDG